MPTISNSEAFFLCISFGSSNSNCYNSSEAFIIGGFIMSIYNYSIKKSNGEVVSLETYRDKTLLIVNTANHCRYTYQFDDLQKMYAKYKDKGVVVLGFPSDQFGSQNPEDGETTQSLCKLNYGVEFPMFDVVDVNGGNTHPLFDYLKQSVECREFGINMEEKMLKNHIEQTQPTHLVGNNIRWNFTKFLIDRNGNIVKRFEPADSQLDVEAGIEAII